MTPDRNKLVENANDVLIEAGLYGDEGGQRRPVDGSGVVGRVAQFRLPPLQFLGSSLQFLLSLLNIFDHLIKIKVIFWLFAEKAKTSLLCR